MPKSAVTEASNYAIPEGILVPALLTKVEQVEIPYTVKSGKRAGESAIFTKWEWDFYVTDGEYAGLTIRGNTEPRITTADAPGGNLKLVRPWAEALLGRDLNVGEDVDTDDLVGLPCQLTVTHQEPRAKRDGEGFWFNMEVAEIFPAGPRAEDDIPF